MPKGNETLSAENWQQAILNAIYKLPLDIRQSVGHSQADAQSVRLTVAAEPSGDEINGIEARYWNTHRDMGWPQEHNAIYGPEGMMAEQAEWPIVSLKDDNGATRGFYVGRGTTSELEFATQIAILETLFQGGVIGKSADGHAFVRNDGSEILPLSQ